MPVKSEFPDAEVFSQPFHEKVLQILWQKSKANPQQLAFINAEDESDKVTYGDLYAYCLSIANFLHVNHFGHKDIACLVLPNCWEYYAIFIGTSIVGGATSGASFLFTDCKLFFSSAPSSSYSIKLNVF